MKKIFIVLIIFFLSSSVWAYPNEPDGFRNLKWGDDLSTFQQKYPDAFYWPLDQHEKSSPAMAGISKYCVYWNGNQSLSGIPMKYAYFIFWDDKLLAVDIDLSSNDFSDTFSNEIDLSMRLKALFGKYYKTEKGSLSDIRLAYYYWYGSLTDITLIGLYNKEAHSSSVTLSLISPELNEAHSKYVDSVLRDKAKQGW